MDNQRRRGGYPGRGRNPQGRGVNPGNRNPAQQGTYSAVAGRGRGYGQASSSSGSGHFSGEGSSRGSYGGGASRGSTRGWVRSQSQASSSSSMDPHISEPPVSEFQSMEISERIPVSSVPEGGERQPIIRPSIGRETTRNVQLLANHFLVRFNPSLTLLHYDVEIKPEEPPRRGRSVRISKSDTRAIQRKLFSDDPTRFPVSVTAYDGEKNIFSAVELPTGRFRVELSEGEDSRTRAYIFSIKLVSELKLQELQAYLRRQQIKLPRKILQAMDLVMKEEPTLNYVPIGPGFYPKSFEISDDLGRGLVASRGFKHSLKPTAQGLALCVDYSVLAVRKPIPVLDFLAEHLRFNPSRLDNYTRRDIERALKGLKVTVTHRRTNQKYTIVGLTDFISSNLSFDLEDQEGNNPPRRIGLVEYFRTKYGKEIKYKNLPCLDFSRGKKINYVPMEFCVLVEGQRYPKELLEKEWANRDAAKKCKEIALAKPWVRREVIDHMVRANDGPRGGKTALNFGIEVDTRMTKVTGRVIKPPDLKVGDASGRPIKFSLDRPDCQWNLLESRVSEGRQIERWGVLDFSSPGRDDSNKRNVILDPNLFVPKLIARCCRLGIQINEPLFCRCSDMGVLARVNNLRELLKDVISRGRLQILVCPMARVDPSYKILKWLCETEFGIVTQCCLSSHANQAKDQYLANLALKMNAKVGGSNFELYDRLPCLGGSGHVMFIGADVNHPGAFNATSPSIAAVVASMNWPAANKYAAQYRLQSHRREAIQSFGEMCLELINKYARLNKVKPEKIVLFRDGVSESQFDMVLNEELTDLKNAISSDGYSPTITLVIAQKRHQTRLFPMDRNHGTSNGNVFPGTVVDTKIVHHLEFDFYLCSHHGIFGTSKPTHYHVLWDEHNFTADQLQRIIYSLCYTFARCTKPVSLVPPVYYADIVAYRVRQYHEVIMDCYSPAFTASSSSSRSSSSSASVFDEQRFLKLHNELENAMFFC